MPLKPLLHNLLKRHQVRRELDDEVRGAFELLVAEKIRNGLDPAAARRAATIEFGRINPVVEYTRDVKAGAWLETWAQDFRHSLRLLRRSPVFTAFAVGSLALGIGAAGAVFQLFDSIVLRSLPVSEPEQLVVASYGGVNGRYNYSMPYPQFAEIRVRTTTLSGVFATYPFGRVAVGHAGSAETAQGIHVSADYYSTLRLTPAAGRLIGADDDRPGVMVAVLGYRYWQHRFGGSPGVVGAPITLNNVPFTIVGVEPAGFAGTEVGRPYDLSIPMRARDALAESPPLWNASRASWIYVMGRLKPGVSLIEAEQELKTIFAQVTAGPAPTADQEKFARTNQLRLEDGARGNASDLRGKYETWLQLLLAMLAVLLLLASLNIATLLLSRSDARQREIATRMALGAKRGRIVRQLLTEVLVLAIVSGGLAFVLASWAGPTLLAVVTPSAELTPLALTTGPRLAMFTLSIALVVCLITGLVPSLRATSARRMTISRQVGATRGRRLVDRGLVTMQVGLSLVLLVSAGLFGRTLTNLRGQDPGYVRDNVLMFSVDAKLAGRKGPAVAATYRAVLDALLATPGIESATVSAVRPVSDGYYFIDQVGQLGDKALPPDQRVRFAYNLVGPGYFATLGIPLRAGRDFDARDIAGSPKVAIISERMARHFTGSPIGQWLGSGAGAPEVIGVAADTRYANIRDLPREVVYSPLFQQEGKDMWYSPTFEVRMTAPSSAVLAAIRRAVTGIDPALTLFRIRTLEAETEDSFARERLLAVLATYFGGFAILLACIGIYGLISYAVTQRTAEIGLRMALGATPWSVVRLAVGDGAWTVAGGAVAGVIASWLAVRSLQAQLFGIEPHDPLVFAAAIAVLLLMALAAALFPSRRASRIDPLVALRHE